MPKLKKFQKEGVKFIFSKRYPVKPGYGILADECGTGKTVMSATAAYTRLDEGSFLIVCTASMKLKWQRELKIWTGEDSYVISGEKENPLPESKFYIINYHILGRENKIDRQKENANKTLFKKMEESRKIECIKNKEQFKKAKYKSLPIRLEGWISELTKKNIIGIIPDEAHRLSNDEAIWTKCFTQLFTLLHPKYFIPLSGTLTRKRTKNLFTILHLTAPALFPNKWKFLFTYCDPIKGPFGWSFDGSSNEEQLNNLLKKVMIRRLKKDVLKELPPRVFSVIPMELTALEKKNYSSLHNEFKKILNKQSLEAKNTYSQLKLLAYLAKRNSLFNWIDEYLEDHDKLILAAWHKKVIDDLMEKYKSIGLKIDGSVPNKKRLAIEDRFQTDNSIKVIILQIDAGGEGLTLTASDAVAIIEMPDTPGQVMQVGDRGHRIGQKAETFTIYFPFANGTIENKIADEIEKSYMSMEAILDGKDSKGLFKYTF